MRITTETIRDFHASLVAMFDWDPDRVWKLKISQALRFHRAKLRGYLMQAQTLVELLMVGFMKPAQQQEILARMAAITGEKPLSIEEEFGSEVAAEVEELDQKHKELLDDHYRRRS